MPNGHDLGLFVDFSICPTTDALVEVTNLITHEARTFPSVNDAVDFAAGRTNTLSPTYPAGYRSRTVKILDVLGVTSRSGLLGLAALGEQIEITNDSPPELPARPHPIYEAETASRHYLRLALEADGADEERVWLERSCDTRRFADEERARIKSDGKERDEDDLENRDPYKHTTGRVSRPLGYQYEHTEKEFGTGEIIPKNDRINMATIITHGRITPVLSDDIEANPEVKLLASINHL